MVEGLAVHLVVLDLHLDLGSVERQVDWNDAPAEVSAATAADAATAAAHTSGDQGGKRLELLRWRHSPLPGQRDAFAVCAIVLGLQPRHVGLHVRQLVDLVEVLCARAVAPRDDKQHLSRVRRHDKCFADW